MWICSERKEYNMGRRRENAPVQEESGADIQKYTSLAVYAVREEDAEAGREIAEHLASRLITEESEAAQEKLMLRLDENGLALTDGEQEMRGDFTTMLGRLKHNNLTHETLVKAAKFRDQSEHLTAIDATAGMGEDSLMLAASGYHVTLCEYNPIIAALLRDTMRRAAEIPELTEIVARMELAEGDSIAYLRSVQDAPDLVLLDPMFPSRKKTGLVKKKFQLLQQLEQPCGDETSLMDAAIAAGPRRVVVKRPTKGPFLADRKPSYSLKGSTIRYDCLVLRT